MDEQKLLRRIRVLIVAFTVAFVLSGLTAFPVVWGIRIVNDMIGMGSFMGEAWPPMAEWITHVHDGLMEIDEGQPFMFYGCDWLAFGHLVIAVFFIGPYRDPVKNIWVIEAGMIACVLVIPLAMICGPIRGIPFFWRVIDCMFGVIGVIPLWLTRRYIKQLAASGVVAGKY